MPHLVFNGFQFVRLVEIGYFLEWESQGAVRKWGMLNPYMRVPSRITRDLDQSTNNRR